MTNKVYTGTTSIKEHIKQLGELYQRDPSSIQYKASKTDNSQLEPNPKQPLEARTEAGKRYVKQSFEIQRLKRESGLCED